MQADGVGFMADRGDMARIPAICRTLRSATESKSETQKQALIDLAQTWTRAALKADVSASDNKPPKYTTRSLVRSDESTAIRLSTR
jgi:hypothetical protein